MNAMRPCIGSVPAVVPAGARAVARNLLAYGFLERLPGRFLLGGELELGLECAEMRLGSAGHVL
jgi:hypothetical protein